MMMTSQVSQTNELDMQPNKSTSLIATNADNQPLHLSPDTLYCVQNVRVLNPYNQTSADEVSTVYLLNGQFVETLEDSQDEIVFIDGKDLWLMPACVDLCARLREPGHQQHGSLKSEGFAARSSGILHVVMPPDTQPILENGALLHGLIKKAKLDGGIYLHILGALTQGLAGLRPANLASLKRGGCIAVSNGNHGFADDDVLLRVLEYAATCDLTVFFYPEEPSLAKEGCAHDGYMASRQGLAGIPAIAETIALAKLLIMVEETGVKAHFSQLSVGASVAMIAQAKAKGLPVTADVAMHQLHLNDQAIAGFNAMAHVRPPLRSEKDRQLLCEGVKSGVIDAICTHHQPLSKTAKQAPFAEAEAGISSFDLFLPLGLKLVHDGLLTPLELVSSITANPAIVAGITRQVLETGGWLLLDPEQAVTVHADMMYSQGKNTPFMGYSLQGALRHTFFAV